MFNYRQPSRGPSASDTCPDSRHCVPKHIHVALNVEYLCAITINGHFNRKSDHEQPPELRVTLVTNPYDKHKISLWKRCRLEWNWLLPLWFWQGTLYTGYGWNMMLHLKTTKDSSSFEDWPPFLAMQYTVGWKFKEYLLDPSVNQTRLVEISYTWRFWWGNHLEMGDFPLLCWITKGY